MADIQYVERTDWHIPRPSLSRDTSTHIPSIPRGSTSSQGSVNSNHSSKSTCSGSLLLTAANLMTWNQIQTQDKTNSSHFKNNINSVGQMLDSKQKTIENRQHTIVSIDNLKAMDKLALNANNEDMDNMSIASSTHFTVVNGVGGYNSKKCQKPACGGHHLTALILTMSLIILAGILVAILYIEMRSRNVTI